MKRVAGIILAAGASSRMGTDKALLEWHGKTLLEYVRHASAKAGVDPVRVVLGDNAESVAECFSFDPEEVVVNLHWREGMLSSVVAGLDRLPADVAGCLLWPVDHPVVSSRSVRQLTRKFRESGKQIVLPTCRGRRGHPVVFSAELFDELRSAPADVGARYVVRQHPDDILELETDDEGILLNLNDPDSYRTIFSRRPPE